MPFAPQHDYEAYNAAIARQLRSQPPLCIEGKFQRYAAYYNTLLQTRRQLVGSPEARYSRKRDKFRLHLRLVHVYNALDGGRDGK